MKNCLIIDIGSTFIKYNVGKASGKLAFPSNIVCNKNCFEVSSSDIFNIVKSIIDDNISIAESVQLSVQMHSYVLQYNNGEFSNYISWQDKRGACKKQEFTAKFGEIYKRDNVVHIKDNLPALSLFSMQKSEQKNIKQFFTLGSFLTFMLCGNNCTHITDATPSGFYNFYGDKNPLVNEFPSVIFPKATKIEDVVGEYKSIKILPSIGDQQWNVFNEKNIKMNDIVINLGTAGQVCRILPGYQKGEYESRPYFNGNTLATITNLMGGKYIFENRDKRDLTNELSQNYIGAIKKVGYSKVIHIIGGAKEYNKELLDRVEKNIHKYFSEEKIMQKKEIGFMVSEVGFANLAVIAKNNGLDFMAIDYEHGGFDYSTLFAMLSTAKLAKINAIVRIPSADRKDITKLMDMGASGLILPMCNCRADAEKLVKYAKYAPLGERGISTMRAHTLYNPSNLTDYMEKANIETQLFVQIETVQGLDNIEDIASVKGISGLIVGPNDLSCDMNVLSTPTCDKVLNAIENVAKVAKSKGIVSGIITGNQVLLDHAKTSGMSIFCIGSELNFISQGMSNIKKKI